MVNITSFTAMAKSAVDRVSRSPYLKSIDNVDTNTVKAVLEKNNKRVVRFIKNDGLFCNTTCDLAHPNNDSLRSVFSTPEPLEVTDKKVLDVVDSLKNKLKITKTTKEKVNIDVEEVLGKINPEKIKWFDAYLQDKPLRDALGIADDVKILYHNEKRLPYIINQRGNFVTYNNDFGIWKEYNDLSKIDMVSLRLGSETKKAGGFIITKYINENGELECAVRFLEKGGIGILKKDIKSHMLPDGKILIRKLDLKEQHSMEDSLRSFFGELEPDLPKNLPYGSPKGLPDFTHFYGDDIEAYVNSFDSGVFKKVNKNVNIYNSNGEQEIVKIIYEGDDCDIDELGRILPKIKVDSTFTGNSKIVSNSSVTSKIKQKMRQNMEYA